MSSLADPPVEAMSVAAYTVPTDAPEADGTLSWARTTMVLVEARSGDAHGVGWSYTSAAAAALARDVLAPCIAGGNALDVPAARASMCRRVRNLGRQGLASSAIAAVETALQDLKARLLGLSLATLLGRRREAVELYGSGGFTSWDDDRLRRELEGWAECGIRRMKMKIGRDRAADRRRVRVARETIGPEAELFVDANGAYEPATAVAVADELAAEANVRWFEEPVTSDDLAGLRFVREHAPAGVRVAAGEYGWDTPYFRRMLEAGAVDVLQADATRCGGVIGFLEAAVLCEARAVPLSAHTAPLLHAHVGCAAPRLEHVEYFHDHVRIERLAFEGVLEPEEGRLRPDPTRPGLGVEVRWQDLERFRSA